MNDGLNPKLIRFGDIMQKDTVQEFQFFFINTFSYKNMEELW